MSNSYIQPKADFFAQLSWTLTHKYRKLIIAILLLLIFALSAFVYLKYMKLQKDLESLQAFEPIYVLKLKRDLNVGDPIQITDLSIAKVFRQEFESHDETTLFECRNEFALSSCVNLISRVVKIPVFKDSILRSEMLAQEGIEPGIVNLLAKNEAFVDITVPQTGFNVYLKPNDYVDIYSLDKTSSKLIAKKTKIIMIDAQPLGKAPMQVKVDPSLVRSLTLAISKDDLYQVTNAIKARKTYLTLHNLKEQEQITTKPIYTNSKPKSFFQALTLIQGDKKEIIKK